MGIQGCHNVMMLQLHKKICSCTKRYAVAQKDMQLHKKICSCTKRYVVALILPYA